MTKHTRKRRIQKGGLWQFSSDTSSTSSDNSSWISGMWNKTKEKMSSGTNKIESGLENITEKASGTFSSMGASMSEGLSSLNPLSSSSSSESSTYTSMSGGKRKKYKKHRKQIKGGKGGLGLTYYATPVSGIKVAEPTTWQFYKNGVDQYSIKGGSKKRKTRRRKLRKTRRHKKH